MPDTPTITSRPATASAMAGDPFTRFEQDEVSTCDAWLIFAAGEIDIDAVSRLQREVIDALTGYDRIIIDVHDVSVLGTASLAWLCCALRQAHRPRASIVICGAPPTVRYALEACELPGVGLHPAGYLASGPGR